MLGLCYFMQKSFACVVSKQRSSFAVRAGGSSNQSFSILVERVDKESRSVSRSHRTYMHNFVRGTHYYYYVPPPFYLQLQHKHTRGSC